MTVSEPRVYARVYCDPCMSRPSDPPAGYKIIGAGFRQTARSVGQFRPTVIEAADDIANGLTASLTLLAAAQRDDEQCVFSIYDPATDKWGEWK